MKDKDNKRKHPFDENDDSDEKINFDNNRIVAINYFRNIYESNNDKSNEELLEIFEDNLSNTKKSILGSERNSKKRKINKGVVYKKIEYDLCDYDKILDDLNSKYNENPYCSIKSVLDDLEVLEYMSDSNNIFSLLFGGNIIKSVGSNKNSKSDTSILGSQFKNLCNYDTTELDSDEYFNKQTNEEQIKIIETLKQIRKKDETIVPNIIKIINCDTTIKNKDVILSKLNDLDKLVPGASEYYKLRNWTNKIMKIPFGKYIHSPVDSNSSYEEISRYLNKIKTDFDIDIYGHNETKDQIIKIIAQTISNPNEGGNVFALVGPPGVGKTEIIHNGIAKALGRPYSFISLGGATDSSYLIGHNYTYEASMHGKVVDVLIQTNCMNPIIYFDELDKVSETPKGEEIINILMHLTDATQNSHFSDRYFSGIDFDLSKAIIIFSFNDAQKVSRILKDRMKLIKVDSYKTDDKVEIAQKHLIPKLFISIGVQNIIFSEDIIRFIIDTYTNEGGVRKLKEILNDILLEINLRNLTGRGLNKHIEITKDILENDILKSKHKISYISISKYPRVGVVNGLWANSFGVGGLIPIEGSWIPSEKKLNLELTGMQGKVMKESMTVAKSVSLKILPDEVKDNLFNRKNFTGIHIHCPDGATPKDGPSAGGAITTCLVSLLTGLKVRNDVAMTGEINLKGQITAIGGLEEKIFGAKKAGARVVICPFDNVKDLNEIMRKYSKHNDLFEICDTKIYPNVDRSDKIYIITVENIIEILNIALINDEIQFNELY